MYYLSSLLAALSSAQPSGPELSVYWGAEDDTTTLSDVCSDNSYGIVNLAFLDTYFAAGGFPQLSLSGLDGPSQAQQSAGATGLKDGSSLVDAIKQCQSAGKLVLLRLGGAGADVTLQSDSDGEKIADTLWSLFGGGTDNQELRPFGDVKLDGFDLDNESGNPTGYLAMVKRFKSNFHELDFVWVQFYNNGDCNIAQSDFLSSVQTWSSGIGSAKLYIGALASDADGDQGFADADTLLGAIQDIKNMNLSNYGGAMLWEAQLAVKNGNFQQRIAPGL
ncbi:glycoside hydrolase family 18 protein [Trichoderma evansii]